MLIRLRRAIYAQLDPPAWPRRGLSPINLTICILILVGTVAAILETEPVVASGHERIFSGLETAFGIVFTIEYFARFWSVAEDEGAGGAWIRRLRFVASPSALVDLVVIAISFAPTVIVNAQMLRMLRLFRILRLAKLGRMSSAMQHLIGAVLSRRLELMLTAMIAAFLLVLGATALYWLEGNLQPAQFGSIPRALWWAVVTLTTIGYGDAVPVTVPGKVVAAGMAICGIGLIAMPTGILAAAFSDAMERGRGERPTIARDD